MEKLLKHITRNIDQNNAAEIKEACGKFTGILGIILNMLLFAGKLIAGTVSASVSVMADGFNNLSDAGTSLISFISFKLSGKPADKEHPYGHARIEYITSMLISFFVLMVGFELLKSSVQKIFSPEETHFKLIAVIILVISILAKLFLYIINKGLGKKISSIMLQATAADSLSDVLATGAVLLSLIISSITHINLDGYMGVLVAAFILYTGYKILRSTMDNIIGKAPELELTNQVCTFIRSYEGILGVHDIMIHSYGTGRCFASAHAEVSGNDNFFKSHELIDKIEREILSQMGIHLVIHIDPIETNNITVNYLRELTEKEIVDIGTELESTFTIHDFRVVPGLQRYNLIFDVVVPYECPHSIPQIKKIIERRIHSINEQYYAIITIDRN